MPAGLQPGTYYLIAAADILNPRVSDTGPVTITPISCTYSLSNSSLQIPAAGGTTSFTINTQAGCQWSASANVNWLTIIGAATGTGSGTIAFSAAADSGAARAGSIVVAGQQFTVNQAAYVNVGLQITNNLVYPVSVSANGAVVGSVNASSTASLTIPASATLVVSFELIRPTLSGAPLGDPMIGYFNAINNPAGTYLF
ncbi:MAG: hypothetical protein ABI165_14190, partial [Bryobacteraceae bacterium]